MKRQGLMACMSLLVALSAPACASKLRRDHTTKPVQSSVDAHGTGGLAAPLDLSGVQLFDWSNESSVDLATFMQSHQLDYLLLTFGSRGCASCNRKAKVLQADVIDKHPLLLTPEANRRLAIVGVNTDPEPYTRLQSYLAQYPFIQLSDPGGKQMLAHFMPNGAAFGVPLTVLLSRQGIVWRILPSEHVTVNQMLDRVATTMGGQPSSKPGGDHTGPGGGGEDGRPHGGNTPVLNADLAQVTPKRLHAVTVQKCDANQVQLGAALGNFDYAFVQVSSQGASEPVRKANRTQLLQAAAACKSPVRCVAVDLTPRIDGSGCVAGLDFAGGDELIKTFSTFFNWRHKPIVDPETYQMHLPKAVGPFTLVFAKDGRLVIGHEGAFASGELLAKVRAPSFGKELARGPDFAFYSKEKGEFGFADWRHKARYSVVNAFGAVPVPCMSCEKELQHWSQPGQLVDFCAERPDDCQVMAVETHLPGAGKTLAEFYDGLMHGDGQYKGFSALNIRVPLALDPKPLEGPRGDEYLDRFFDGYLSALYPQWNGAFGTVIYDREGKIVAQFQAAETESGEAPSVLDWLKKRLEAAP